MTCCAVQTCGVRPSQAFEHMIMTLIVQQSVMSGVKEGRYSLLFSTAVDSMGISMYAAR